jgi:hypothetical protein
MSRRRIRGVAQDRGSVLVVILALVVVIFTLIVIFFTVFVVPLPWPRCLPLSSCLARVMTPKEAMLFVGNSGCEEKRFTGEGQAPQAIEGERNTIGILQRPRSAPVVKSKALMRPVAKVADEQRISNLPEFMRRARKSPRGVQRALRGEAPHQVPFEIEDVDEAVSLAPGTSSSASASCSA